VKQINRKQCLGNRERTTLARHMNVKYVKLDAKMRVDSYIDLGSSNLSELCTNSVVTQEQRSLLSVL